VYFLGNFTTEVSQDKRLKKSDTNFVFFLEVQLVVRLLYKMSRRSQQKKIP